MPKLTKLLTEFFNILDTTEESDSGTIFHPVQITSCRVMQSEKVESIIQQIKSLINYHKV